MLANGCTEGCEGLLEAPIVKVSNALRGHNITVTNLIVDRIPVRPEHISSMMACVNEGGGVVSLAGIQDPRE